MTIKAYGFDSYGGPETQDWFDLPDPTPGPSEVLVRVRAIGVNPVDWKIRGGFGAGDNTDTVFPLVLGVEAAGTVLEVGEDVEGVAVGDEVFGRAAPGHGTYAELAVLDGVTAAKRPPQVEPAAAASIGVSGVTALVMTEQLALTEGRSALVTGAAGSVGVQVLQLLRNRGVATFGVASSAKRAMVESLGGVLVPYDADTDVVTAVRELLPDGVDAVYDLVGGDALKQYAALVKTPGNIMSAAAFDVGELGGQNPSQDRPRAVFERVVELMAAGDLDPKITDRYPFDEAPAALATVESGHALGKVVIDMEQTTRT